MTHAAIAPIRKEIVVEAPQERAFRVFTENLDAWWPRSHHIGKADMKAAVMEQKVDGRWYEVGVDGSECNWGKVLVWDPPRRLVLAWQIDMQWQFDASLVTEVEVTFTADGPRRTRVELEHRNLERFGATAQAARDTLGGEGGWPALMALFAKVSEG